MTEIRTMSAEDLSEELALYDLPDDLWVEITIRLGVEGANGIRVDGPLVDEARLRVYVAGRREAERMFREESMTENTFRPPQGLQGTHEGTCVACGTPTDTHLGVIGTDLMKAALLVLGVPDSEVGDLIDAALTDPRNEDAEDGTAGPITANQRADCYHPGRRGVIGVTSAVEYLRVSHDDSGRERSPAEQHAENVAAAGAC